MLSLTLALRELASSRLLSLCRILGLAATLLPLLILLGVKNGVLAERTAALLSNPESLRIGIAQTGSYPKSLIDALAQEQGVRFISPQPMQMALLADMAAGEAVASRLTLLATGDGDPYLPQGLPPPKPGEVIITAAVAGKLGLTTSAEVELLLKPRSGGTEGGYLPLKVIGTVEADVWGREGALLSADDLFLVSDWSDGKISGANLREAEHFGHERASYPSIRLYASDIPAAMSLVENLAAQGIATSGSLAEARALLALSQGLEHGFTVLALVTMLGAGAALAAGLWFGILKNRRQISLLRLAGLSQMGAVAIFAWQALVIACLGWLLALGAQFAMVGLIDNLMSHFIAEDQSIAALGLVEIGLSGLGTAVLALVAAIAAGVSVTSITPEEGLRDA